jgi:hypothetical protein
MTEHDSLIGAAYNDGYDEGFRDGTATIEAIVANLAEAREHFDTIEALLKELS